MDADATCAALPREDPEAVRQKHACIAERRGDDAYRDERRGVPMQDRGARPVGFLSGRSRHGLTLTEIATETGAARATLKAAMIHHGYLEEVPYGGRQRRTLVTAVAFHAGLGHTADPSATHSPALSGWKRCFPFPVFYPDRLADIMWTLGLDRIAETCASMATRQERLAWLLAHHPYLPNEELRRLSGMAQSSVDAAAARTRAQVRGEVPAPRCDRPAEDHRTQHTTIG
jgi:hypothetical protein